MVEICVVGGGLSGLTFANFVKKAEVLEKEKVAGGLARSIYEEGYTFDLGSHIIFSANKDVLKFMLSLLGKNKIKHKRNTKILYKGRYVKYPFENGLDDLPKKETFECLRDYVKNYIKMEKKELKKPTNFKEWMLFRFGKSITEKYLYPYNKKIWNTPPEKMACFWVEGRVPQPSVEDVMKAALSLKSEGYLHQLYFYYPLRGGYQAIPNAITKNIKNRLKTSFEVKEIRKEEDFVVYGKRKEIKTYKKIVSTIHILDFLKLYRGTPSDVLRAAKKLHWNSAYLVMIGIKKPKINNMHWLYIPDENILANRISFPHNYSPYVTPRNHSSILAEITYSSSQKIAKEEPEKIKNRVIEELSSLKFFNKNEVVFSKIINVPYAYVVYTLDYEENINKIYNFVCEEGVTLLGRFSEFKYYNADKCIERAMETAKMFKK